MLSRSLVQRECIVQTRGTGAYRAVKHYQRVLFSRGTRDYFTTNKYWNVFYNQEVPERIVLSTCQPSLLCWWELNYIYLTIAKNLLIVYGSIKLLYLVYWRLPLLPVRILLRVNWSSSGEEVFMTGYDFRTLLASWRALCGAGAVFYPPLPTSSRGSPRLFSTK